MQAVLFWRFDHAPKKYRKLSAHGGDEDWIAVVPEALIDDYRDFLADHAPFPNSDIQEVPLADGRVLFIGAHA